MRLADMGNRGKITKKDLFNLLWMALEPKAQNKASINWRDEQIKYASENHRFN